MPFACRSLQSIVAPLGLSAYRCAAPTIAASSRVELPVHRHGLLCMCLRRQAPTTMKPRGSATPSGVFFRRGRLPSDSSSPAPSNPIATSRSYATVHRYRATDKLAASTSSPPSPMTGPRCRGGASPISYFPPRCHKSVPHHILVL
jgi:hypothetical protein